MPSLGVDRSEGLFGKVKMRPYRGGQGASGLPQSPDGEEGRFFKSLNGSPSSGPEFVKRDDHSRLGKEGFLKLLTHQMANQDPLRPTDQKRFVSDLAQLAQLEQMSHVNQNVQKMGQNQGSESKFYGASFLDKEVLTKGASVRYDGRSDRAPLPFSLSRPAQRLLIRLFDEKNQMIAQYEKGAFAEGAHVVPWNGRMRDGQMAGEGDYRFDVLAWDAQQRPFLGETKASGRVTGVSFENGETILTVDHERKVFLRDVLSFRVPKEGESRAMALGRRSSASSDERGLER